jgi:REP element-mobilizing transposase RayT
MVKEMKEKLNMVTQKEKVFLLGQMVKDMKENLKMGSKKEKVFLLGKKVEDTKENLKKVTQKEKVFFINHFTYILINKIQKYNKNLIHVKFCGFE